MECYLTVTCASFYCSKFFIEKHPNLKCIELSEISMQVDSNTYNQIARLINESR